MDGIVLLDKPPGLSSHAATANVRKLTGAARAGHVGSLDPLATGMLPVCLGEATKVQGLVASHDKSYRFSLLLGVRTTTGDAEGEIAERQPVPVLDPGFEAIAQSKKNITRAESCLLLATALRLGAERFSALERAASRVADSG